MIIHQCISGYTQDVNTLHGVLKLSERLRQNGLVDGVTSRVQLNLWHCDWKKVAEYYWLLSDFYSVPLNIAVYAYSWGAGWGAMELARHLNLVGLNIKVMVLSDPVYRHPKWYMRWKSLLQRDLSFSPIIKVPTNVGTVYSLNQTTNRPMGHRLLSTNGTVIHPTYLVKNTVHQKMDDSWKFHMLSVEVAKRMVSNDKFDAIDVTSLQMTDILK